MSAHSPSTRSPRPGTDPDAQHAQHRSPHRRGDRDAQHGNRERDPTGKRRRAFTAAELSGRIERGGDPALAEELAAALTAAQRDRDLTNRATHALHTYPARLHPATARQLVELVIRLAPCGPLPVVLDPFCGSGTTLVESRYAGARAIGVDANPLAVMIARAKTWTVVPARRAQLCQLGRQLAATALAAGKAARRAGYATAPLRTPPGVSAQARDNRLRHWFAPHVRRELEYLAAQIDEVRPRDPELADIFSVVLSSILYKVSRRASDTDPSLVDRRIGRGQAARLFRQRIDALDRGLAALAQTANAPPGEVHCGDARHLDQIGPVDQTVPSAQTIPDDQTGQTGQSGKTGKFSPIADASIDAVVTSPPYAGTYDYEQQHRLRFDFLGLSADPLDAAELGARRQFRGDSNTRRRARRRYHRALAAALREMARVVRPGGAAAIVLGDSVAGERAVWAQESMRSALAGAESWQLRAWAGQRRPQLGALERRLFADRPKCEWVFLLLRSDH